MAMSTCVTEINEEDWNRHRDTISSLYLKDFEDGSDNARRPKGHTLKQLAATMKAQYGFEASESQIEGRLKAWGIRKNLKPSEWRSISERLEKIPQDTRSRVLVSGRVVSRQTVDRARKRYSQKKLHMPAMPYVASLNGSSITSILPHQVKIEIQSSDGTWMELADQLVSDAEIRQNAIAYQFSPFSPLALLGVIDKQKPAFNNGDLRIAERHNPRSSRTMLFCEQSRNGWQDSVPYVLGSPYDWLQDLPSRLATSNVLRVLELSALGSNFQKSISPMACLFLERVAAIHNSTGYESHSNAENQDALFANLINNPRVVENIAFEHVYRGLMSPPEFCRFKFTEYLLSAIVSGIYDVSNTPSDAIGGLFHPDGNLDSLLSVILKAETKHVAATLVSNLFQTAIIDQRHEIVLQFLKMGLCDPNDSFVIYKGVKYTYLEFAAGKRNTPLVEVLLSYGADPNKTYKQQPNTYPESIGGALSSFLRGTEGQASLIEEVDDHDIPYRLLVAGAKINLFVAGLISPYNMASIPITELSDFMQASHEKLFARGRYSTYATWRTVIMASRDDLIRSTLVNVTLLSCKRRHGGRCLMIHQDSIDLVLLGVMTAGQTSIFQALFPHSSFCNQEHVDSRFLSAAIIGKDTALIHLAMALKPDINPTSSPVETFRKENKDFFHDSTPLGEAIRSQNTELLEAYTSAGIFESVYEGERFRCAIMAAVEAKSLDIVARLLHSCPDLESQDTSKALLSAIESDQINMALMLIESGAAVNCQHREISRGVLTEAVAHGNSTLIHSLLETGARQPFIRDNEDDFFSFCTSLMRLADWKQAEQIISCLLSRPAISHNWSRYKPDEKIAADFIQALSETSSVSLILDSHIASASFLTTCLHAAIKFDEGGQLVQLLIRKGADFRREDVLIAAANSNSDLLRILLDKAYCPTATLTAGANSEVLNVLIRNHRTDSASLLVKSGLADISGFGRRGQLEETPLGVALSESNYEMTSLLLKSGCDPRGIVERTESSRSPSTRKTALLAAIKSGRIKFIELLIEYGANLTDEMPLGVRRTPLQMAAETGDMTTALYLLERGADLNEKPAVSFGGTALQLAAISGNCNLAAELLQRGALLHMPPSKIGGRWPIEGAAEHGRLDMIQFLWRANQETIYIHSGENGFQEQNFRKAIRLATENGHDGCRDLIAELAGLKPTDTNLPPIVSPMYIDWPPP
ncbi:hypothetical protein F5Y16DRAFT_216359 [Xylariaceae sp. FL0255]|nr:hypothetical protein F5Y16DRAFT_216359 [Xylariaceae sp. FL0255]